MGEVEQLLLGKPEQRTLEYRRQRQIVGRKQKGVGQDQKIHDGDVIGQQQPVRAGDRDAGSLDGADDRLEQCAALADQNENVAGLHRVTLVTIANEIAAIEPRLHRGGNLPRQLDPRTRPPNSYRMAHPMDRHRAARPA